jgi:hypothetical protein
MSIQRNAAARSTQGCGICFRTIPLENSYQTCLPGEPTAVIPPAVVVPAAVVTVALVTFTVALQESLAENLLVLAPVSVRRVVAISPVFVVVRSLWVITLTTCGIGAAYVQPIAVTLVSRNLINIAVTVTTTIDIPVVAAVCAIVVVRVIHAYVAVAAVTIIAITIIAITLTLPFAANSLIAIPVAPILAVTPRPLRLSCCARDYRNTE